jgi:hypothetical protein
VSDVSSPVVLDPNLATCYHGDYDTSTSDLTRLYIHWSDDRGGTPDVWLDTELVGVDLGYLDGTVSDANTTDPIEGAQVTAERSGGGSWSRLTDSSGYYTVTLLADTYTVTAQAFGYIPGSVSNVVVITDQVTTVDFNLDPATVYTISGTVTESGSGTPLLAEVEILNTPITPVMTDPATGFYSIQAPEGEYTMRISASFHQPEERDVTVDQDQTQDFALLPLPCILLVDDDNNDPDVLPYFTAALDNLGYDYDIFDVGGGGGNGPALAELQGYSMVMWFSGDKYGGSAGPNEADETNLAAYLDGGGRLFLSSQDYLYDFGLTPFGQDYLGIGSYTNDTGDATTKYGVAGDPIGDGLGPYPLTYPTGFTDYGDVVNAAAGASVSFTSIAGGGNNLDVDKDGGDWKTVFFGTDWVPVYNNNAANGEELLGRIVEWFGGCELSPQIELNKTVGTDPNACATSDSIVVPAGTEVTYCYEVTNTGTFSLTLHDLVDSELGTLLDDFPYTLLPSASAFITETTTINENTTNTATWTAYVEAGGDFAQDSDTATVTTNLPPDIVVDPLELEAVLPPDASTMLPLTISNVGEQDLEWTIAEAGWYDSFDSYAPGSQMHGQGGWKGWFNDPSAGALVSDLYAHSPTNSVQILGASDLVHEYAGFTSGTWTYTTWQYVPSGYSGQTYFIMLNSYDDAGANLNWSTQVYFDSASGQVVNSGASGGTLPLIIGAWVELRVEIDLDNDTQAFYYDDQLLYQGTWTDEVSGGGVLNIGAVDLFANSASRSITMTSRWVRSPGCPLLTRQRGDRSWNVNAGRGHLRLEQPGSGCLQRRIDGQLQRSGRAAHLGTRPAHGGRTLH